MNYRWVIVGLTFAISLINYLDRSAIGYAIEPLRREFGIDKAQFGTIAGAFGLGYMFMIVAGGMLVDRIGPHRLWAFSAIAWSSSTACMGFAQGFMMFCFLRALLGITEGPHFPALTRVMANWLPDSERARAIALGLTAVPAASAIGAPLISNLILSFGWRVMFMVLGSLGIVWAIFWLLLFRDQPEQSLFVGRTELAHIRSSELQPIVKDNDQEKPVTPIRFMLTNPTMLANSVAFFAFGYLQFFSLTWLPGFFETEYGMKLEQIRYFLIFPFLLATILLPIGGWLSDRIYAATGSVRKARSHLIWVCQLMATLCLIPLLTRPSFEVALACLTLGVGFGLMPNSAFYSLHCDLARDRAATSMGIMGGFLALATFLAPTLTGFIAERTGDFVGAFALLIGFNVTSICAVFFFQKPDEQMLGAATRVPR